MTRRLYNLQAGRPELTKAHASQQTQLALMGSDLADTGVGRGGARRDFVQVGGKPGSQGMAGGEPGDRSPTRKTYAHPYYWAPFIRWGIGCNLSWHP